MTITWDEIETLRDQTFQRTPKTRVTTMGQARKFINRMGFCFAFTAKNSELPCLWHAACGERKPVYPEHTHSDPHIGLVWQAKDDLVADRSIYYGKALKNRPTMISLEFFPCFYRLLDRKPSPDFFLKDYMAGQLSPAAKRIMEALTEHSPQVTAELKLSSAMSNPKKRTEFDRAMAELQMKMYIVKIAEFYDPFTFLWELTTLRFNEEINLAQQLSLDEARQKILQQYFRLLWVSDATACSRLFSWPAGMIQTHLQRLLENGFLDMLFIHNEKKPQYALKSLCRGR